MARERTATGTRHHAIRVAVLGILATGCNNSPTGALQELPRQLTASEKTVISAGNEFAFGLLREVSRGETGRNVFVSPLSAAMALGMTANGARGATQDEMRGALGYSGLEMQQMNEAARGLVSLLTGLDRAVEMQVANSVWYRQDFPVEKPFVDLSRQYFGARVSALDFGDPAALGTINGWVETNTRGRIEEIIGQISPTDVMYLINAVYFKAPWREPFDRRETRDAPFHNQDGTTATVKMMHRREGPVSSRRVDNLQVVELPYARGAFAMTILLPERGVDVDEVIAGLTAERWTALVEGLPRERAAVSLPRFRLEYAWELNDPLRALGMRLAFTGAADFSGMTRGGGIWVSEVMQKTFVEVNEEGTEAAAATSVTMTESLPPEIRMDRPFIFAIRERLSGSILFIGKLAQAPAA